MEYKEKMKAMAAILSDFGIDCGILTDAIKDYDGYCPPFQADVYQIAVKYFANKIVKKGYDLALTK